MKRKLLRIIPIITLSTLLLVGCGTNEETSDATSETTIHATKAPVADTSVTESIAPIAQPTEIPAPTKEPVEELTKLGGDEYVDRLFTKLTECESYQNGDFFYRENAMGELVNQLKTFDFIKDVSWGIQLDKTIVIKFKYANDMEGSYHMDYEFTEKELALYEDWDVIESLIDDEIRCLSEYDGRASLGYFLRVNLDEDLEKGRISAFDINEKGVTFTGKSGIEYFYEYRYYEQGYLSELFETEMGISEESKRRRELSETITTQ